MGAWAHPKDENSMVVHMSGLVSMNGANALGWLITRVQFGGWKTLFGSKLQAERLTLTVTVGVGLDRDLVFSSNVTSELLSYNYFTSFSSPTIE